MKKTLVSLAAASLIVTSAVAADKGIDIVTTGQAVVYYQTTENNGNKNDAYGQDTGLFSKGSAKANVGVQLNLDADLKNNFTFGTQLTYLGTAGLEGNLVSGVLQNIGNTDFAGGNGVVDNDNLTDEIALTKIFIAKKIANTTVKIGRQELPQALSPLAYSEGWNVFKNTFEALLVVNTDVPDTTLVGAYVSAVNDVTGDLGNFDNIAAGTGLAVNNVTAGAYMLTAQNKSLPMTTITASYYDVAKAINNGTTNDGISAMWFDASVADKSLPMGLKVGLQGGMVMTDTVNYEDTTAFGVRVGMNPIEALTVCAAFSSVDGASGTKKNLSMQNMGGIKTPLYTQMIFNQDWIKSDANTFMLKAAYNTGDYGMIIAQASITDAGDHSAQTYTDGSGKTQGQDLTDLELVYKIKAGEVDFLAAYIHRDYDKNSGATAAKDADDTVRLVARYNF